LKQKVHLHEQKMLLSSEGEGGRFVDKTYRYCEG